MKAQWSDGQYNVHYLFITNEIRVCVAYDGSTKAKGHDTTEDGYKVTFLGHTMKGRPKDLDKAKAMAVQFAAIVLNRCLEAIQ